MEMRSACTTVSRNVDITVFAANHILLSSEMSTGISLWLSGAKMWRIHSPSWFKRARLWNTLDGDICLSCRHRIKIILIIIITII